MLNVSWMNEMIEARDVTAAYKLILDRSPESAAIIESHVWNAPTLADLRNLLLQSDEFLEKVRHDKAIQEALLPAARVVIAQADKNKSVMTTSTILRGRLSLPTIWARSARPKREPRRRKSAT